MLYIYRATMIHYWLHNELLKLESDHLPIAHSVHLLLLRINMIIKKQSIQTSFSWCFESTKPCVWDFWCSLVQVLCKMVVAPILEELAFELTDKILNRLKPLMLMIIPDLACHNFGIASSRIPNFSYASIWQWTINRDELIGACN